MCVWVTRCRWISRSISSGSNRSISTTGWPSWIDIVPKFSTAVWYSGEQHRCTFPSFGASENSPKNQPPMAGTLSGSSPVSARRTPLGRPDVPDV